MNGFSTIRVLIADDHPLFRAGVISVLSCHPDMELVGEAATGEEAIELARSKAPHVVLLDLQMPKMGGIAAISTIRQVCPETRILVISTYSGDVQCARATRLGASGCMLKDTLRTELVDAIRKVAHAPPPKSGLAAQHAGCEEPLPERELEILGQIALARSNEEIAAALHLSPSLVKVCVRRILVTLGAQDRTHAVVIAIKRGIIVV
jgi:DNA-binding NarL/FixJ family response regulator